MSIARRLVAKPVGPQRHEPRSFPTSPSRPSAQVTATNRVLAPHRYLRYGLSYRDLEELLAERGIEVDHVTVYRWVQRFTPLFADAARPSRHATGDRWFVDETYGRTAVPWTATWTKIVRRSPQAIL